MRMIRSKHHRFYVWMFKHYIGFSLRKHFAIISIKGDMHLSEHKAILLIGNHFSWWDGHFAAYLNHRYYHKRFHVMMLEEQLKKYPSINKAGAFGINLRSRDLINGLNYSAEILNDPENILVMFPQGAFASLYHYPVSFQRGVYKIIEQVQNDFDIVFMASLVDYFSSKKPRLTLSLKQYNSSFFNGHMHLQDEYNRHLTDSIKKQKE